MKDRPSYPTVKDDTSTVFQLPTPMMASSPKKRLFLFALIVNSLLVLLIVGVLCFVLYQNHVNQTNAYNAYLSALSGNGTLVFSDPLSEESQSQWSASQTDGGTCQFEGNAYHIKQQSGSFLGCNARSGTYSDFAFEVQLTIIQGGCGGIFFRDQGNGFFYYFHICQTGYFIRASVEIIRAYAPAQWSIQAEFAFALTLKPTHTLSSSTILTVELALPE